MKVDTSTLSCTSNIGPVVDHKENTRMKVKQYFTEEKNIFAEYSEEEQFKIPVLQCPSLECSIGSHSPDKHNSSPVSGPLPEQRHTFSSPRTDERQYKVNKYLNK